MQFVYQVKAAERKELLVLEDVLAAINQKFVVAIRMCLTGERRRR